jgi:excinuclease ABC subunit A
MGRTNDESILLKGVRVHNLKGFDLEIPRDQFVVITGPSGSGKSSLAFDTIYAEGQRRYVESLSAYARQFLEQLEKPDVDVLEGLSPTISIQQRTTSYNPRSTVGTVTEIHDYLRLLYSRIAKPFCFQCHLPITSQSPQQITDTVLGLTEGTKVAILAPIIKARKGEHQKELAQLRLRGFVRIRVNGETLDLAEDIKIEKNKKTTVEVFVDRLIIRGDRATLATRVSESIELALKLGEGEILIQVQEPTEPKPLEQIMSEKFACTACGISYPSPEPRTFSFNSPMGACSHCDGLGIDPKHLNDDRNSTHVPNENEVIKVEISPEKTPCPICHGTRLKIESRSFYLAEKNISDLSQMSLDKLLIFFTQLSLTKRELLIAEKIIKEVQERLQFLNEVGVNYLSLSRSAQTLSGGEAQRIRLATQIGSALVGVIYVLDEPSIGLHQRDNDRLIETLKKLRDLGNTVIVVEHDRDTMEKSDFVVDLGPGAGALGGQLMAYGPPHVISQNKKSITGRYLSGDLQIEVPKNRRKADPSRMIRIEGCQANNLKNVDVDFPLGSLICVTGVSGSGKSTLIIDTLYPAAASKIYKVKTGDLKFKSITGLDQIDKIIDIDQSPIGRTPRSNPATYTGLFTLIRDLFAQLPDAQIRGFGPGRFSFNVQGGRCETCEGDGTKRIEMHFLPDVYVRCETCKGRRYHRDTLEILYKGKSIADVLEMTCDDAYLFFDSIPSLKTKLKVICDVGLGYLQLGQSATTLSGGEAQRIKLSKELSRRGTGRTLYVLDEPSTGLHFDDVKKLIGILQGLVDQGNTVVVIEHNLDIIKVADHIIDVGPEGGALGGKIVASGTPEQVARSSKSITAPFIAQTLK